MIRIEMSTENAAFEHEQGIQEASRILKGISERLKTHPTIPRESEWDLRDINGNVIGRVIIN